MTEAEEKPQKPFEYLELLAMCWLCVARAVILVIEKDFKDEKEGKKIMEDFIPDTVNTSWNRPGKEEVRE